MRQVVAPTLLVTLLSVGACRGNSGGAGDTGYARDADTGAAAPATTRDLSQTRNVGESTSGVVSVPGNYPVSSPTGDTLTPRVKEGPGPKRGAPTTQP